MAMLLHRQRILQSIFTKVTDAEPRGNIDLHALAQLRERTGAVLGSDEAEAEQDIRAEEDEDAGEIRDGDDGDDDGGDDGGEFGTEIDHEEELGAAYMLIMEQDYQRQVARGEDGTGDGRDGELDQDGDLQVEM
jgi:hypothetical protein